MLDLGSLLMESDAEAAARLPADAAALYQCLRLTSRDISAYLVDGAFSFAALERAGAAAAGPVRPPGRRASRSGSHGCGRPRRRMPGCRKVVRDELAGHRLCLGHGALGTSLAVPRLSPPMLEPPPGG